MASGKQLSFQYGEVSPSLRFRSDAVSYASGLSKLTNMYVRRAGGVSNRQGFEFVKLAETQGNIPAVGDALNVKAFTYWSPILKEWVTAEFAKDPAGGIYIGVAYDKINPSVYYNVLGTDFSDLAPSFNEIRFTVLKEGIFVSPGFPAPSIASPNEIVYENRTIEFGLKDVISGFLQNSTGVDYSGMINTSSVTTGKAPFLEVSYLLTATFKDGQEEVIAQYKSGTSSGDGTLPLTGSLAFPHAALSNRLDIVLDAETSTNIKKLNLYRAGGNKGFGSSFFTLVGSQLYKPATYTSVIGDTDPTVTGITPGPGDPIYGIKNKIVNISSTTNISVGMLLLNTYWPQGTKVLSKTATTVTLSTDHNIINSLLPKIGITFFFYSNSTIFTDYGVNTPSITPPIDSSMIADSIVPFSLFNPDTIPRLGGVKAATYYQQRLIMAMDPGAAEDAKTGTILVSKIGAPKQVKSPQIYSDTEAFSFSIPVTDGTPCIALLSMERLMAFTEQGVYIIRGGEQGVLTPTTINPVLVSQEGCSKIVEPKMSGRKGYFVNNNHTKLMAIAFGDDGNVTIFEATVFSDHMLYKDIVQLEVLGGGEDTVYLLRRDGKLVRITTADEGSHGFSLIETDGYVESIYRGKAKRPYNENSVDSVVTDRYYDVLMCYIIRNGHRILERLNLRDDLHREGEFFADCYGSFGMRLSEFGNEGYTKIGAPDSNNPRINIETSVLPAATRWLAGSPITIWCTQANIYLPNVDSGGVIHFFYDDAEGNTQFLRYIKNPSSLFATGDATFTQGFTGYFEADVPESLRDARNQSISLLEQKKLQTRWAPALNYIPSSSLEGVKFAAFKNPLSFGAEQAAVSIMADGEVISSPNNPYKPTLYLDKDYYAEVEMKLPDYYTYGYIGIPYTSEFETLDLEAGGEKTLTDAKKLLNAVGVGFNESRGGFFGMPNQDLTNMEEIQPREDEDMSNQSKNTSGHLVINVPAGWNEAGRVNIKQVDPAPITILSVYPKGISGD